MIAIPTSTATAFGLSFGNKAVHEMNKNKSIKHKKRYELDQQTIKSIDKYYIKTLQQKIIDKSEDESLCNFSSKIWRKQKQNLFYEYEREEKNYFFINDYLKLQSRT